MQFTDQISILIFALVLLAVAIFLVMSKVIVGPVARLKPVERWVLGLSLIGVVLVIGMAASELLFHKLF
jgi:multisubunit Na+/H+ antiporter MnhF subunit